MGGNGASSLSSKGKSKLNPYAEAFTKKHGKFNAVEYMHWIESKHSEFQTINNIQQFNHNDGKRLKTGYDAKTMKKFIKFINK